MGSTASDLKIIDSVVAIAGAAAAIFGGIAGLAGLLSFLGTAEMS